MVTRRNFLRGVAGVCAASVGVAGYVFTGHGDAVLEHIQVSVPNLPRHFHDYRIGFITDLHLGEFTPLDWIAQSVSLLEQAQVRMLLLGGDYIFLEHRSPYAAFFTESDYIPQTYKEERFIAEKRFRKLARLFESFSAPDGVYAVFGNHDRHIGRRLRCEVFSKFGVSCLENASVEINRPPHRLRLIGVEDYLYEYPDLPMVPGKKHADEARVLLTHNPDFASYVMRHTDFEFDLALCGHTHGGQIRLPGVGAITYNIDDERFASGLVPVGRQSVYTSRGLGTVTMPVRINCPAEVTVLTLKQA